MGVAVAATLVLAVATTVSNTSNAVVTHPMASSSSAQWTVGSGETFLTNVDGLFISEKTITCTLTSATGTATGKCLKMTTTTLANHEMGPWCTGGFWDKKNVVFPQKSALISSCMCQRYDCDGTCSDMCMECTPIAHERTYIIPLSPVVESADRYAPVVATTSRSTQLPLFTPLPLALSNRPSATFSHSNHTRNYFEVLRLVFFSTSKFKHFNAAAPGGVYLYNQFSMNGRGAVGGWRDGYSWYDAYGSVGVCVAVVSGRRGRCRLENKRGAKALHI